MIAGIVRSKWALPAFLAGMALFFAGCRAVITEKAPPARPAHAELFEQAEAYRQSGDLDKALSSYDAYIAKAPRGDMAALALHRMGSIYLEKGRYHRSLSFLERVIQGYSGYSGLCRARYQMAVVLFRLGRVSRSIDEAGRLIEECSGDPAVGETLLLLGKISRTLGNDADALKWWLRARAEWEGDLQRRAEIDEKIEALIGAASLERLESLMEHADGSEFAPAIRYRMASLFFEQNDMDRAKEAATALIGSTSADAWLEKGRLLLEKIMEEMSVRPGVVGCLLPLSGPFAIYGEEVLNGIQLGLGIPGGLEVVIRDTVNLSERDAAEIKGLVRDEKVLALIGPLSSSKAEVVAGKAQELGVPIITLTQKQGITEKGDMVFRNFLTPLREVERVLGRDLMDRGIRRFAILYPDNSYGRFFMNLFWDRVDELGGEVTAVESYDPEQTDFADNIKKMVGLYRPRPGEMVEKLKAMRTPEEDESEILTEEPEPIIDFDAVFIPDVFQRVALIAPQLVYHDVTDVQLMGTSLWQSPRLTEMAGDYVQEAIIPSGFLETSSREDVRVFVEEYQANYETSPGILAATGYDTIRLIRQVIAGKEIRTRRQFREALSGCSGFEGVTGRISFDYRGEVEKEALLLVVSGSRIVEIP